MKTRGEGALLAQRLLQLEPVMGEVHARFFEAITALNDKRFQELLAQLSTLQACQVFTPIAFEEILKRVSHRLGAVAFSKAERITIKKRGDKAGILIDGTPYYFSDKKRDQVTYGGTASVEKIYCMTDEGKEYFALKKINKSKGDEDLAKKEAKYNHSLFHRKTMLFKSEGAVNLVTPWISGDALDKINERHMKDYDVIVRIEALLALLADIHMLHQYGRMHLDVKPSNVIFDLDNKKIQLIDFGSALRALSQKKVGETMWLLDKRSDSQAGIARITQDMFSLLHIYKALFPELGLVLPSMSPDAVRRAKASSLSYLTQPIWYLMSEFINQCIKLPMGDMRLTVNEVMEFFMIVKDEFYTMTPERAEAVIHHFKAELTLTYEAVLCGRRSLM